jgi:hypothetical protein
MVLCGVLAGVAEPLRLGWLDSHKTVIGQIQGSGYSFGVLLRAPDGTLLTFEQAFALVPTGVQDPDLWLYGHGCEEVQLGVTDEVTRSWTPYEVTGLSFIGLGAITATGFVVNRRRPT